MLEGFPEIGVSMLALDGNAEKPCASGQEVRIRDVELAGLRTVDFEDAEEEITFATPRDQNVYRAPDPVIRQELWRSKSRFLLKVIGSDHLRFHVDSKRYLANRPRGPADAGAHQQPFIVGGILQDFGEWDFEALGTKLGGPLQDLSDVAGLQRGTDELAQQGLLPQAVRKLLPGDIGRCGRDPIPTPSLA
jgi:hypothetical protein